MTDEATNTGAEASTTTVQAHGAAPIIPTGIQAPKPLKMEGNLAANSEKIKRSWTNYAIIARLDKFEESFKTALFLSVIGEEAGEVYEGKQFETGEDKHKLNTVLFHR